MTTGIRLGKAHDPKNSDLLIVTNSLDAMRGPSNSKFNSGTCLGITSAHCFPEMADIGDGGLLSGLPCAAPCVYGIRIGETPLDQVIPTLRQNGLSECLTEENLSWIGITCGYSVVVQVDRATSIVNATGFYPSVPISLEQIIENTGSQTLFRFKRMVLKKYPPAA